MNKKITSFALSGVLNIILAMNAYADMLSENISPGVMVELEMASDLDNGDTQKLELNIQPEIKID